MCGIFGYIGNKNPSPIILNGLADLEYRGYDSAGIAGINRLTGRIELFRVEGKVSSLKTLVEKNDPDFLVAIGHTRWATHGRPCEANAHPHLGGNGRLALVHNGIIENFLALKEMLVSQGFIFHSDTDSEVIAHLLASFDEGDFEKAIRHALPLLQGAYALAIIHVDYPDQIFAVAKELPLLIGLGEQENLLSSDGAAFRGMAKEVIFLADGEIATLQRESVETFDSSMERIIKNAEVIQSHQEYVEKGTFDHFTLKEIFDQPNSLRQAIVSRFDLPKATACLEGLSLTSEELHSIKRIVILGCGTSYHAGLIGRYLLEEIARIPTEVEIGSEFRYKNPLVGEGTLAIAISQSGETADTIAAMRELQAKGTKVIAICNVYGSTMAREADGCLFNRAGLEIGVCSTKAFTTQIILLALLSLQLARMRHLSHELGEEFLNQLLLIPMKVERVLESAPRIQEVAERFASARDFFFVGRHYLYPTSLEAALKLKEISYINANGLAGGELKHGVIALIDQFLPTVALCANKTTLPKIISNMMEIRARGGKIIAFADESMREVVQVSDEQIWLPETIDPLAVIPTTVAAQLFAYFIARKRGANIDQPRNLAKSVTVE